MSANRTKLIAAISLSILLCIFGCIGIAEITQKGSEGQAPIRSLRLTINRSQREELFDQLREFAEKHGFEYELTDFNTNGENFQFWMSRDDMRIIANNVPPIQQEFLSDFMLSIQDLQWMKKRLTSCSVILRVSSVKSRM